MSRNMTIPSRPAPPPPQAASNKTTRYSPATNWDDTPFNSAQSSIANAASRQQQQAKKPPPPRPPPPKVVPALKKPGQPQSINILSNLFGQKRHQTAGSKAAPPSGTVGAPKGQIPTKLPPPPKQPPPLNHHAPNYGSTASTPSSGTADLQLISFDSPPSSPTFTQKSCSDCISVDSFSSDSNYSSPNNGSMSQAESGFEDDFVSQNEHQRSKATTPASSSSTAKDLWDLSDPFGMPPPGAKPFPANGSGGTNSHIYAPLSSAAIRAPAVNSKLYAAEFVDPLCNGKTVAPKVQTVAMPTIIKSSSSNSSSASSLKSTPVHDVRSKPAAVKPPLMAKPVVRVPVATVVPTAFDDAEESLDSLPSLPMPNIPPPPPPVCVEPDDMPAVEDEPQEPPYGVAMYDFPGETDEDLAFRMNDKIYLLKRLNEEWLLGRDRRGCEGMFPANYIEVRIPLRDEQNPPAATSKAATSISSSSGVPTTNSNHGDISHSGTSSFNHQPKVKVMYTFNAETHEDLTIVENEYVTVLYQINSEWLYGEWGGKRGQFPANFIEYVPPNLPLMPADNSGV